MSSPFLTEGCNSGNGRLITICDVDSPPAYPVMTQMNFPKELITDVLSSLNWATADETHTPRKFLYSRSRKSLLIASSRALPRAGIGFLRFGEAQVAPFKA